MTEEQAIARIANALREDAEFMGGTTYGHNTQL